MRPVDHTDAMRWTARTCWLLLGLLAGCQSTLGRAPGPEAPELAQEACGTLILPPVGSGATARTVRLIDLPSLRELQVRLEHDPIAIAGVDANGQLLYAFEVDADVKLGDYLRGELDLEPQRSARFERWRMRRVDVTSGVESDLGARGLPEPSRASAERQPTHRCA